MAARVAALAEEAPLCSSSSPPRPRPRFVEALGAACGVETDEVIAAGGDAVGAGSPAAASPLSCREDGVPSPPRPVEALVVSSPYRLRFAGVPSSGLEAPVVAAVVGAAGAGSLAAVRPPCSNADDTGLV